MTSYLIVDDSPTIRLSLAAAIKRTDPGAQVGEAADANEAMSIYTKRSFDIIFLDMMLGGGPNGLSLLRSMLAHRPDSIIVIVTGLAADHPDIVTAVSQGAFAHLQKPVRTEAVRALLSSIQQERGRQGRIR